MRKIIYLIILFILLVPQSVSGATEQTITADEESKEILENFIEEQKDNLDLREFENFILEVDSDIKQYIPEISFSNMLDSFKKGELDLSPQEVLKGISRYFLNEVARNLNLLGKLIIIAVVCSVLSNLQMSFESGSIAKMAYFICLLALITIALGSFNLAVKTGLDSIYRMVTFMKLLLPILLVLLTAMGGLTSAALLQPFLMVFLNILGTITQGFIFPLIYLTAIISIANNISDYFKVSRIAAFIKQITKVGIGLVLTLFIGVITVEGVAGAVVDGVTLRTAKYMTGAFVPVAGSMFADALDAVIGGSLLLKNAVGLTGVLVLGAIVIFPVIEILVIAIIYRLTSALLQPIGNNLIADTLEDMAGSLFLAFAAVASVAIMFFLTVVIVVGTANFTVMLR